MIMQYRCPYCHRSYRRESWYLKHQCEKKKRFEQIHQMDFIRGLRIYSHWRKHNGFLRRGKQIDPQDFINSPFYNTFMALVKFTSDNWVVSRFRYLDFLMDRHVAESQWMTEETLAAYRDWSRRSDPVEQIKITHQQVMEWCDKNSVDPIEFFTKVPPGQALEMIRTNRISPWVLFGYPPALELLSRFDDDRLCSVDEFLNSKYWIHRIQQSEETKHHIQAACNRMFSI